MKIAYSAALFFCVVASAYASDSILGCGGHVRAEGDLDLRKIVVKLLTKQGALKYETDVAPSNGYFFLPVYDRGDYVVKVEPPEGWTFQPESIPVSIDGSTDDCSTGKDLTFKFQGFSVLGKVTSGNAKTGPQGITVVLTSAKTKEEVSRTETGQEGDFMFPNVNHGQYYLHLAHPKWKTQPDQDAKDKVSVSVDTGNGEVKPGQLQVLGFDVSGRVTSEGEAMKGVNFLLFGSNDVNKIAGCTAGAPKNADTVGKVGEMAFKCHVTSNDAGVFEFPVLPPGSYQIVPSYVMETGGTKLQFDVKPTSLALEVAPNQGSIVFEEDFVVAGFGVTGHVLTSKDKASGLSGASVFFNGQKVGETDSTGTFSVASVKAGEYRIEAQADGYQFEPLNVKISPKFPVLPDLVPSKVKTCGKLGASGLPEAIRVEDLAVAVDGGESFPVSSDGSWCAYLPHGSYVIRVSLPASAQGSGLSFAPYDRKIVVADKPLAGLDFVQFKAIVAGKVSCTLGSGETCSGVTVHLKPKLQSSGYKARSTELKPSPEDTFEFTDVLPGPYEVSVTGQGFCWDKTTSSFEVSASDVRNIAFQRTGVSVVFDCSHSTNIDALVSGKVIKSFQLPAGEKEECFRSAGLHEFVPNGCHAFGDKVSVEVGKPGGHRVALKANRHILAGAVKAEVAVKDLMVVMHEGDKVLGELGPLIPTQAGSAYSYNFEFWAAPGDTLKIVPKASRLLFEPTEVRLVMKDDCVSLDNGPQFTAKIGLFFSGAIAPPLEGVTVTVKKEGEDTGVEVVTGNDGRFVVGPLKEGKYSATASKDGYDIKAIAGSAKSEPFVQKLDFTARKLAEISVLAASTEGEPLAGVLVTVSGATDYRQNRLTDKDGRISFIGLAPGEYFVKPVLKEYKFDPTSVVATVKEGESLQVDAKATRVAYSTFGSVVSLSNEPEPGITVEAIGNGPSEQCKQYAEEAATDQEGNFRIRGLSPTCNYVLKVKNAVGFEFSPAEGLQVAVSEHKDVTGLRLILFRPGTRMAVSATIITPEEEFLTSLRAVVYREDRPDVEITSKRLTKSSLFVLPVGLDRDVGKKYVLRLESSLPTGTGAWEYRTPEVTFAADRSFKHFNIEFNPTRRSSDLDFKETSVIALPLVILVAFAVVNFGKIWPSIAVLVWRSGGAASQQSPSGGTSSPDTPDLSWIDSNASVGKKKVRAKKIN